MTFKNCSLNRKYKKNYLICNLISNNVNNEINIYKFIFCIGKI